MEELIVKRNGSANMENELQILNVNGVDCYEKDGVAYLKLENVARGLGFTQQKNNVDYIRWETVNGYISEFGFPNKLGKDDFIPENIFYRLAMKAKNETAEKFQALVADEIIPSVRRHGAYMTPTTIDELLENPDMIIRMATVLKEERAKRKRLEETTAVQALQIAELQPKASYYDLVLACKDLIPISVIAKDYGWSAKRMNEWLRKQGVQYRQGKIWILYQKFAEQGYTQTKTHTHPGNDGIPHASVSTYWTQKGRLFIYDRMKSDGVLPIIERGNDGKEKR